MARRLEPEVRRAEIIAHTRAMIAEGQAHGLSLRAVARRCGMSAPGLMHHFPDLSELLTAVLRERDEEHARDIESALLKAHPDPTLLNLVDTVVRYYADRPEETRNYDAFEAEAFSPQHPAHEYFKGSAVQPWNLTVSLARNEYANPGAVVRVLALVADGLRSRWLREEEPDYWGDWVEVRDAVFATFPHL